MIQGSLPDEPALVGTAACHGQRPATARESERLVDRAKGETGYSLVEVMVSIMLLTLAIIPMVSMFDTGLNTATMGSNYDKARALAKKQLEQAQSLPYVTVKNNFPNAPCTFNGSGLCESTNRTDSDSEFSNFRYSIRKQFVVPDNSANPTAFDNSSIDRGYMRVTVIVGWGGAGFDDTEYTATSLKAR